jgi:hypothetical protein
VRKGQKGIRIVAAMLNCDGKVTSITPVSVFDLTQTQELARRAAA